MQAGTVSISLMPHQLQARPRPLTISTAVGDVARGWLNSGHNLRQIGEARAGEGQHLRGGIGRRGSWGSEGLLGRCLPASDGLRGSVGPRASETWGEPDTLMVCVGITAYICTAALIKVRGPPVCEHFLDDITPAPASEHRLPVLVAHILQEAR